MPTTLGTIAIDGTARRHSAFNMLSQTLRITRSRHTGWWIVEELNTVYGYWATKRGGKPGTQYALPERMVQDYLARPTYVGPLHPADLAFRTNTTCG